MYSNASKVESLEFLERGFRRLFARGFSSAEEPHGSHVSHQLHELYELHESYEPQESHESYKLHESHESYRLHDPLGSDTVFNQGWS